MLFCFSHTSVSFWSISSSSSRLCPSTAGCSPPSMSSKFHLRLSVAFLIQVVPSFSVMSSCHLLLGRPLDLFPLLGCHSVHRLVHLLSFNLAIWPAHFHFCFSVSSMILMIFVLFLISEHGILSFSFRSNIFLSIALWAVLSLFVICLFRDHVWQPYLIHMTEWNQLIWILHSLMVHVYQACQLSVLQW